MKPFDITDTSTWPVLLTLAQVAAIYQRKPGGLAKACQLGSFRPSPMEGRPYRWRRADVLRAIDGGRAVLGRTA